jgi:type IV pilus assembly protein PilE
MPTKSKGFSLLELMIVLVVVGILGAVAFPQYKDYIKRGYRSQAEQALMEIASKQSQYILDARGYADIMGTSGLNWSSSGWTCSNTSSTPQCSNNYYNISVTVNNSATPPTFTISAVPKAGTTVASDGTLNYGSDGTKTRIVNSVDQGW